MVEPGRQCQADLAYDLGPELQCCGRLTPAGIGQIGPNGDGVIHSGHLGCHRRQLVAAYLNNNANDRDDKLDAHNIDCCSGTGNVDRGSNILVQVKAREGPMQLREARLVQQQLLGQGRPLKNQ